MVQISTNASALAMAQEIFGTGVTVVGATYTGDNRSSGIYTQGDSQAPGVTPAATELIGPPPIIRGPTAPPPLQPPPLGKPVASAASAAPSAPTTVPPVPPLLLPSGEPFDLTDIMLQRSRSRGEPTSYFSSYF